MNSSGIKRGLAASAIGALAVAGLPLLATSASAVPLNTSVTSPTDVILVNPDSDGGTPDEDATPVVSTRNDGQNTTYRLQALGGVDVQQVRFQYSLNGTDFVTIATVDRNDNGSFAHEWDASVLPGAAVTLRAVGVAANGEITDTDSQAATVNNAAPTANITNGNALGVFQKPDYAPAAGETETGDEAANNVVVSGTTSAPGATPTLRFWDADTAATEAGNQPGWAGAGTSTSTLPQNSTSETGTFSGVLDITGYNFGASDELLVKADLTGANSSDDTEAFTLYRQTITTVTATADRTNVQAGNPATVTVTVVDQNGAPIAGAEVRNSDGTQVKYTDARGRATFAQNAGSSFYYANATASDPYEAELGDKRSEAITVTQYSAAPTSLQGESANGAAFDLDEWTVGDRDISVQVQDQQGQDLAGVRTVQYYIVVTPFDGGASTRYPTATTTTTTTTNDQGEAVIERPSAGALPEGTYEVFAGVSPNPLTGEGAIASSRVLTFKAGQAEIVFDDAANGDVAAAGTDVEVSGRLVLDDGTGLPSRPIRLTYARTAGEGGGAAAFDQPNGAADNAVRDVVTDGNGRFSATLDDPAVTSGTQPTERGTVTAATTAANADGEGDHAGATATQPVVFAQSTPPSGATVTISGLNATGDNARPGVVQTGTVTVSGANGAGTTSNQVVTLTVDGNSFFTDDTNNSEGTPAVGDYQTGRNENLGKTITVVTGADGAATFYVTVGRSAEFDDDGFAEDIVTATSGSVSDTEDVDYTSANPLNAGEVRLEFSPASEQEAGNQPPSAKPGTEVEIDVYTEDQFGNLVGNQLVTLSDDTNDADIIADDASTGAGGQDGLQVRSNFDDNGDFAVTADEEETQTVTATWNYASTRFVADGPDAGTALDTQTSNSQTDTITVNYENVTVSDATISSNPEGTVRPGTAVTETVTVRDEDGNPVPGVTVRFTQNGPGDTNETMDRVTNAQGQAFYVVTSSTEGTANITAVVETGDTPIVLTDQVRFEAARKSAISPSIRILNQSDRDTLFGYNLVQVRAPKAEGARVDLFRVKNGVAKRVKSKTMNDNGFVQFKRADLNGSKKTFYYAVVRETEDTLRGRTDTKGRR